MCPSRSSRIGFTLLELIVVVVLLAVLAGAVAPRIAGSARRRAEAEAGRVEGLLSAAAQRDAHSSEPLALWYDREAGRLFLAVLRVEDAGAADRGTWTADPAAEPVGFELLEVQEAAADGQALTAGGWRVEFPRTEPRPHLALTLGLKGQERAGAGWRVTLQPEALAAVRTALEDAGAPVGPGGAPTGSIDLDAAGRGDEPW